MSDPHVGADGQIWAVRDDGVHFRVSRLVALREHYVAGKLTIAEFEEQIWPWIAFGMEDEPPYVDWIEHQYAEKMRRWLADPTDHCPIHNAPSVACVACRRARKD